MVRLSLVGLFALALNLSVQAEEIRLQHKGLTATAELVKAGEEWTQGPVLLMTHGTLAHNRMEIIDTLQTAFQERGIASLAINLTLGLSQRQGMYDCQVPHRHRHTDAVDEIGLWLGWLKTQGVESVVLLGHSRGGNQTAWFAAERDEPTVRGVVLLAPQTWSQTAAASDYQRRHGKPLAPLLQQAERLLAEGGDALLRKVGFIYCPEAAVSAEAFTAYYRPDNRLNTLHLLPQIPKPTLLVAASEDTVVQGLADQADAIRAHRHVQFTVIEGADHFFRDLYAEEVADLTVGFIEGL